VNFCGDANWGRRIVADELADDQSGKRNVPARLPKFSGANGFCGSSSNREKSIDGKAAKPHTV
jgi:hypothetical protein